MRRRGGELAKAVSVAPVNTIRSASERCGSIRQAPFDMRIATPGGVRRKRCNFCGASSVIKVAA